MNQLRVLLPNVSTISRYTRAFGSVAFCLAAALLVPSLALAQSSNYPTTVTDPGVDWGAISQSSASILVGGVVAIMLVCLGIATVGILFNFFMGKSRRTAK